MAQPGTSANLSLDDRSSSAAAVVVMAPGGDNIASYVGSPARPSNCPAADVLPRLTAVATMTGDGSAGDWDSGGDAPTGGHFLKKHGGSIATHNVTSSSSGSSRSRMTHEEKSAQGLETVGTVETVPLAAPQKTQDGRRRFESGINCEASGADTGGGMAMGVAVGMGVTVGARSSKSNLWQSSGDLMSLAAAAEGQEGRGLLQEAHSPAAVPESPPGLLLHPGTPNQDHSLSPSDLQGGYAEADSPRPWPPISAATTDGTRGAVAAEGDEEGDVRPSVAGAPQVPPASFSTEAEASGSGGGLGVERNSAPWTASDHPPPAAAAAAAAADNNNNDSGVMAVSLVSADEKGRAGRDYGPGIPGIPVTRVASWSTFGDEGSGTIFGGEIGNAPRRGSIVGGGHAAREGGGHGAGEQESTEPLAHWPLPGASLRRQRKQGMLTGSPDPRPCDEDELSPSADWITYDRNGKACLLSDEERAIEAGQRGDLATVKAFLDNGGDIELRDSLIGMTLLAWAARKGHTELARLLLSKGASANARDGKDRTPLHRACTGRNADVVKVLLEHGADPNARDQTWRTPLHRAGRWGAPECSTLLLDAGADIEARDRELARTPLHFASRSGGLETTLVLLNNGADFNSKTVAGNTPLHLACDRGLLGNVKLLVEWGADPNAKNEAGAVPSEVAAPWVDDSVKANIQEVLASTSLSPDKDSHATTHTRPQPAVVRPRPKGAAEKEVGLMESIRSQRNTMADCPRCQQGMLRQTHTLNSNGVPGLSSAHGTYRNSSLRSLGELKVCPAHRSRAQPGEGGLPGLDDDLEYGSDEIRPRKGMGKTRKKQLSSNRKKYEGGCCRVQ